MYPFDKQLTNIEFSDIENLVAHNIAENEVLDFKEKLPTDGNPTPWKDGWNNNKAGKHKIAKELVAFANASGGTLIIGIEENKENRAEKIHPIEDASDLKDRLTQVIYEIIEPPLPSLKAHVVPGPEPSTGIVIFQTEKSLDRPHRINMKWSNSVRLTESYIRRGTNSEPMTMREIQQISVLKDHEISDIKRKFDEIYERFKANPVKGSTEFRYEFFASPVQNLSLQMPDSPIYTASKAILKPDDGFELKNYLDDRVFWQKASRILGGRSRQYNHLENSHMRYWWMKNGSFRFHCNEKRKGDGSQHVNPYLLLLPLCYLARWRQDILTLSDDTIDPQFAVGFVIDNSKNLPLSKFSGQVREDGYIGKPEHSEISQSEIYEFRGINELEIVAEKLAEDLFSSFNARYEFGPLKYEGL